MRIVILMTMMLPLLACHHARVVSASAADPLETIPQGWVDLPDAPFVAQLAGGKAVLLNRSGRDFNSVSAGCVVEQNGRVRVVGGLFAMDVVDGVYSPGTRVEGLLRMVNNIDWYVENAGKSFGTPGLIKRCADGERIAVTKAALRGTYQWSADGTLWPE